MSSENPFYQSLPGFADLRNQLSQSLPGRYHHGGGQGFTAAAAETSIYDVPRPAMQAFNGSGGGGGGDAPTPPTPVMTLSHHDSYEGHTYSTASEVADSVLAGQCLPSPTQSSMKPASFNSLPRNLASRTTPPTPPPTSTLQSVVQANSGSASSASSSSSSSKPRPPKTFPKNRMDSPSEGRKKAPKPPARSKSACGSSPAHVAATNARVKTIEQKRKKEVTFLEEQIPLKQFVDKYSKLLPVRIVVTKGYCGGSDRVTISTQDCFNVHFLKHTKVIAGHDLGGEAYNIPVASAFEFGILYNPRDRRDEAISGYNFERVSDLIATTPLPKVISALDSWKSSDGKCEISQREILVIKKVHRPKLVGKKSLKVYSLTTEENKVLTEDCNCSFTTRPYLVRLHVMDMLNYMVDPFPCEVCVFLNASVMNHVEDDGAAPQNLSSKIIYMSHSAIETALVTSVHEDRKRYSTAELDPNDDNGDEQVFIEIPIDLVEIDVSVVDLSDETEELYGDTRTLIENFDPSRLKTCTDTNSDRVYNTQSLLSKAVLEGYEKYGVNMDYSEVIYQNINRVGEVLPWHDSSQRSNEATVGGASGRDGSSVPAVMMATSSPNRSVAIMSGGSGTAGSPTTRPKPPAPMRKSSLPSEAAHSTHAHAVTSDANASPLSVGSGTSTPTHSSKPNFPPSPSSSPEPMYTEATFPLPPLSPKVNTPASPLMKAKRPVALPGPKAQTSKPSPATVVIPATSSSSTSSTFGSSSSTTTSSKTISAAVMINTASSLSSTTADDDDTYDDVTLVSSAIKNSNDVTVSPALYSIVSKPKPAQRVSPAPPAVTTTTNPSSSSSSSDLSELQEETRKLNGLVATLTGRLSSVEDELRELRENVSAMSRQQRGGNFATGNNFASGSGNGARFGAMGNKSQPADHDIIAATSEEDFAEINKQYLMEMDTVQMQTLLQAMDLQRYSDLFMKEQITGELLMECDDGILSSDLGISSKLHRMRLLKIIAGKQSVKNIIAGVDPYVSFTR